jgi:hypothetical protein
MVKRLNAPRDKKRRRERGGYVFATRGEIEQIFREAQKR